MINKIGNFILQKKVLFVLFVILALFAGIQALMSGNKTFLAGGLEYTHYNNYIIFEQSFHHLLENKDLYSFYPQEHWDLFKYTPTFAAFFWIICHIPGLAWTKFVEFIQCPVTSVCSLLSAPIHG